MPVGQVSTDNKDGDVSTWVLPQLSYALDIFKEKLKWCLKHTVPWLCCMSPGTGAASSKKKAYLGDNIKCLVRSLFSREKYQMSSFII